MLYRGYLTLLIVCLCIELHVSNRTVANTFTSPQDTLVQFFNRMELLRLADKNQQAITELSSRIHKIKDQDIKLKIFNELAENYRLVRDDINALKQLQKVIEEYTISPNLGKEQLVRCQLYRGKVFRQQNLYDSAEIYHFKTLELDKQHLKIDHELIGEIWMDLGLIQYSIKKNYRKGLEYNLRAQEIFHKSLDKWDIKRAVLYYALASIYRNQADF